MSAFALEIPESDHDMDYEEPDRSVGDEINPAL